MSLAMAATAWTAPVRAAEGELAYLQLDYAGVLGGALVSGSDASPDFARVAGLVDQAGRLVSANGDTLLPAGTVLDRCELVGNMWNVDLTLPAGSGRSSLSAAKVEALYAVLGRAVDPARVADGLAVRARDGAGGAYDAVDAFGAASSLPQEQEVRETPVSGKAATAMKAPAGDGPMGALGGSVIQGTTQPTGALSGVVVFCAAGHGWTAGSSSWYLQRPLLLDMIEDYGNLDQLNYMVHYLFNAGATVVPFRPVGYTSTEVVLDNDDAGVTWTGSWSNSTATIEYYENGVTVSGVPYRWATASASQTATARYTPSIPTTGFWPVYCWTRDGDDRVRQTYRVGHSGGVASVVIDHRMVGKGWIWLGNYHLLAGTSNYVEITNASPDSGVVIADAIRFGNGMGDISRPGPGTISGYPREEECSKYWAMSEAGNHAVGMDSAIWGSSGDDSSDNVGTAARWGAAMNRQSVNNDRWRRAYIEFHTNAAGCGETTCGARGTVSLVSSSAATTNQTQFATILGDRVEDDLVALGTQLDYPWVRRSNPYAGGFGAISTYNNGNEFDATLIELAFHDNVEDTANLLDPKARSAMAKSTVHGMIEFLAGLAGSTVPLVFPPASPGNVRAVHDGAGGVTLSWTAPPSGNPNGGAATGYRIYRSTNGYGYDNGVTVGNVTSHTLTDVPAATTTFIRISATNAGGESMPSEVLAVRTPTSNTARVLIVSGFDRVSSQLDPTQTLAGVGTQKRPLIWKMNTFDYVVQHASSVSAYGVAFDSSSNDAVESGLLGLSSYEAVVWFCGENYPPFSTLSSSAQSLLTSYLNGGGRLMLSGAHLASDLDSLNNGRTFYEGKLGANYLAGSAGTSKAIGKAGTFLGDVAEFFYGTTDAAYRVSSPDVVGPQAGATTVMQYKGRTLTSAAVAYATGGYKAVTFGFPFESIVLASTRDAVMVRVLDYLIGHMGDCDRDGDVDGADYGVFAGCFNGTGQPISPGCSVADLNNDGSVDGSDYGLFASCFNGSGNPPACAN